MDELKIRIILGKPVYELPGGLSMLEFGGIDPAIRILQLCFVVGFGKKSSGPRSRVVNGNY